MSESALLTQTGRFESFGRLKLSRLARYLHRYTYLHCKNKLMLFLALHQSLLDLGFSLPCFLLISQPQIFSCHFHFMLHLCYYLPVFSRVVSSAFLILCTLKLTTESRGTQLSITDLQQLKGLVQSNKTSPNPS